MPKKFISRFFATLNLHRAIKLNNKGDTGAARELMKKISASGGREFILPHVFEYELQMKEGNFADGVEKRRIVENLIQTNKTINIDTKNYIRYYMLRCIPDAQLDDLAVADVCDPSSSGIANVDAFFRRQLPYRSPQKSMKRLLKDNCA